MGDFFVVIGFDFWFFRREVVFGLVIYIYNLFIFTFVKIFMRFGGRVRLCI